MSRNNIAATPCFFVCVFLPFGLFLFYFSLPSLSIAILVVYLHFFSQDTAERVELRGGGSRGGHPGQVLLSPKHSAGTVPPQSAHTDKDTHIHLLPNQKPTFQKRVCIYVYRQGIRCITLITNKRFSFRFIPQITPFRGMF